MAKITTRFAPSPTGYLHLGHGFAALTAERAARAQDGRFLLRIEDIDVTRCKAEFETAILEDLAWLGLAWDGGIRRQSEHFPDYAKALEALDARGLLYPCFCTRKEVEAEIARAGQAPHGPEGALYPGTCRVLGVAERNRRKMNGANFALRLDVIKAAGEAGPLDFNETGAGPNGETGRIEVNPLLLGDVVLARKDVPASYHLSVVVDDAIQDVTLVTRGHDLFFASHIQRLLQELLGLPAPAYAHHCLILDHNGKKFSKRDSSVTLRDLRRGGKTPDDVKAMIGL